MAKGTQTNFLREAQRLVLIHPEEAAIALLVKHHPGAGENDLYERGCDIRKLRRMAREKVLIFEAGGGYYPITAAR